MGGWSQPFDFQRAQCLDSSTIFGDMAGPRGVQIAARLLQRGTTSTSLVQAGHRPNFALWSSSPGSSIAKRALFHAKPAQAAQPAVAETEQDDQLESSNPAMSFPCLDAQEQKTARLQSRSMDSGPEPSYTTGKHLVYRSREPFLLDWGGT